MGELYSTKGAAGFLSSALPDGGDSAYWSSVLVNNRRIDRTQVHRIPFSRIGKGVFYTPEDLARFVDFEKARRVGSIKLSGRATEALQAFGIGEKCGSAAGRRFEVAGVTRQVDEATGKSFVRLITTEPLMIYRLELDEAKAIAKQLMDAAKMGKRGA
jgi:hypothetical protein